MKVPFQASYVLIFFPSSSFKPVESYFCSPEQALEASVFECCVNIAGLVSLVILVTAACRALELQADCHASWHFRGC